MSWQDVALTFYTAILFGGRPARIPAERPHEINNSSTAYRNRVAAAHNTPDRRHAIISRQNEPRDISLSLLVIPMPHRQKAAYAPCAISETASLA